MRHFFIIVAMFSATSATAGGFEASRLDTKFMYEEGQYAEISSVSLNYDVKATVRAANGSYKVERSVKSDQSRATIAAKFNIGKLDIGFSQYNSGTIQLIGNAPTYGANGDMTVGSVPNTDVMMDTLTFVGKTDLTDEFSILFGVNRNTLKDSKVTTALGVYTIKSQSNTSALAGFAYSKPEIAMRVELLIQPSTTMKADTSFDKLANAGANPSAPSYNTSLSRPDTMTLNFQSGVAEDTLIFGSIHSTDWGSAQIDSQTGTAATSITSQFWDTKTYSLGIARKMSDSLLLTGSVSKEVGGKTTTSSSFTVNNGYKALSLGARYIMGKMTISGGYNYLSLGDFDVINASNVNQASYRNNNVSALAFKIGISF